jgi:hypothetical protein
VASGVRSPRVSKGYSAAKRAWIIRIMQRLFKAISVTSLILAIGLSFSACKRTASTEDETPDTSTYRPEATPATEFEQKLKVVRDGHFQYVWVFSRIDGRAFTPEDSQILHTNAPKVVDWVGMDDKKKFIAGSNFPIDPPKLTVLQKRFKIEDYSGK